MHDQPPDATTPPRPSSSGMRAFAPAEQLCYWLRAERSNLVAAVSGLTEDEARLPLAPTAWSVQEILAHRVYWEQRELEALEQYLRGESMELLRFPLARVDAVNAAVVERLHDHAAAALLRNLQSIRTRLLNLAARVPDADLNTPDHPVSILLGVALEHDREHTRQILQWRNQREGPRPALGSPTPQSR